jgi:small subunit ribosomal protein S27e
MKRETYSSFVNVKCTDCGNVQVVFDRTNTKVSCTVCGSTLALPSGGKALLKGEVLERVDRKE